MFYNILYATIAYPLKDLRGKRAPRLGAISPRLKALPFNPLLGVVRQRAYLALLVGKQTLFSLRFYVICSHKVLLNRNVLGNRGICGGYYG